MDTVKTYEDDNRHDKVRIFFNVDKEGNVSSVLMGNQAIPSRQGHQFYVDEYVALQVDKIEIINPGMPILKVKDGEEIEIPDEVKQNEDKIKRLEKELNELKGMDGTNAK
ncbi:hypothetical protein GCM10011409_00290 [Lentibacillus populi]|uniref:Uncharacterized protein n=1 Tax=Lentibacillus populi TaxID=1827502 RepID=A0A9W5X3L8_9BACI|nr:hypothetical protein [Lentibacillus populi]MBT2215821.1 hypothetical protein [Virgibacillus dakarensis]MBT2215893.1 hypothetical protein [Virgibacillus dakarensis]GGB26959.1 hypothetical protein GCM10011409_00290 [Lentibacillus populi]